MKQKCSICKKWLDSKNFSILSTKCKGCQEKIRIEKMKGGKDDN